MNTLYFVGVALVLVIGQEVYFYFARKYGILDHPNDRSMHEKPTIRGGGIVFYLAAAAFFFSHLSVLGTSTLYFFLALTFVSAIGLLDDIKSQSTLVRFLIQSIAFFILFYGLGVFAGTVADVGVVHQQYLPLWWIPIAFIVCTGTLNAYNFMDGINGITGGYSMVILAGLYVTNTWFVPFVESDFLIVMMIGVMIFNFYNFRTRAVCFAGDVGSTTIGFVVIYLVLKLILVTGNYVFIGMLAVYAADSLLTILHRIWRRENILKAHRLHFFQIVVSSTGITHLSMTVGFMIVQTAITAMIITHLDRPAVEQYRSFFIIAVALTILYVIVKKKLMPGSFTLKERTTG